MNNYDELDELDKMHYKAKMLSFGNRWAYLALMIAELAISCIVSAWIRVKGFIYNLF